MRHLAIAALAACLALPASAQTPTRPSLEIQAKRPLPTGKYAVDLEVDSELGRDLRRVVMERLAARGNQVGFSGGHVVKLRVDLTRNFAAGPTPESVLQPPRGQTPPGGERADGRPQLPERSMRDLQPRPGSETETLRITLTMREAGAGEVVWVAYASCAFGGGRALDTGRAMIGAIFSSPDRSRRGEADCPL